jgi:hypothetical protein
MMSQNGDGSTGVFVRLGLVLFGVAIVAAGMSLAFGVVAQGALLPYGGAGSAIAVTLGVVLIHVALTEAVR